MKVFTREIWSQRKIVMIFLLGIIIPSLCVGFLSWNAFLERRETFRRVVESQLWISGETAIESIESTLEQYELSVLSPENFVPSADLPEHRLNIEQSLLPSREQIFLLDAEFRIKFPQIGIQDIPFPRWDQSTSDSPYASLFQRAEYLEFEQKNYAQAAEFYQRCILLTPIKRLQAIAMEREACCLMAVKRYEDAFPVYEKLLEEFGSLKNRLGHPYGLIAALKLRDIAEHRQLPRSLIKTLSDVLARLKDGEWPLQKSTYDFYSEELEDFLEKELSGNAYPELEKAHKAVLEKSSPYMLRLEYHALLEENVIPILKERIAFSQFSNEPLKGRFPVICEGSNYLVSYSRLHDLHSDEYYYAGFCWDLEYLKQKMLPEITASLALTSGIQVHLIDGSYQDGDSDNADVTPKDAYSVSFRQFPFPWSFVVTQNALEDLKSTALRENILFGTLLVIILGLMCLGALLIVRDISRESTTTRQKSDFVHNISHELKTPLTLIRLYGETLRDNRDLPEEILKEAYETITSESERLSHMINNVLDFSRIEMRKKEFNLKSGQLAIIVRETLDSYRYHLENNGFTIHEDIDTNLPPLDFDREAMASVLVNLLSNAMKFSPMKKEVHVRLFRNENNLVLQVEDQGIGISPKEIHKIFRRFYRSENNVTLDSRGSGLGLTIIQHITEAHGGRIEVDSEPGKGSMFSVILPVARSEKDLK
jgi:signal transduction histidine kinase